MKTPKATLADIKQFLEARKIAIAGVSRNPQKFGYQVFNELKERGYELYPVNPNADKIDDLQVYSQLSELPEEVKHLLILTSRKWTEKLVMEAIAKGIDHIWIQQMSDTPEAVKIAREAGVRLVTGQCIFMWAEPVKIIHKFHKTMKKIFGLLPK
ncbi:MAG: CoA-binding protein [Bacteroidetes bacterium]|nr:MAG: CoA-binding protein [Bacteroidota bacterium]